MCFAQCAVLLNRRFTDGQQMQGNCTPIHQSFSVSICYSTHESKGHLLICLSTAHLNILYVIISCKKSEEEIKEKTCISRSLEYLIKCPGTSGSFFFLSVNSSSEDFHSHLTHALLFLSNPALSQ